MKSHLLNFSALCLIVGAALIWQSEQTTSGKFPGSNNKFPQNSFSSANQNLQIHKARAQEIADSSVFSEFEKWLSQFSDSQFSAGDEQIRSGSDLALKRRELLKELIQIDPQAALEKAVPAEYFNRLPAAVVGYLEQQISARGEYEIFISDEIDWATGKMTGSQTRREVEIGKSRYEAFVYGRRLDMTAKNDIPVRGIALDGLMALDENPARLIEPSEFKFRQIESFKLTESAVAAEIGGEIRYFSSKPEFEMYVSDLIQWEAKIQPERSQPEESQLNPASAWTEGVKKVLFIRVDFSDRPGEPVSNFGVPITEQLIQNLMANEVNPFFVTSSYNKTSLVTTVTPVIRLPQPQSFYTFNAPANQNQLLLDARAAARAAGYETNNFDLDSVVFSFTPNFAFAAAAGIGSKGMWVNGVFEYGTISHELGHNYGLWHGNLWRTSDGTVIGQGQHVESFDAFDGMGGLGYDSTNSLPSRHFNARYKNLLNWLTNADIQTVTTSGTYRIFAQDSAASGGIRALKINKDATRNYWVEFRQLFTNNPKMMNGATIRWDYPVVNNPTPATRLLDMTPETSNVNDAALAVGQTFVDDENRLKITILGKGNTAPESLDVRVEFNAAPCSFSLEQSEQKFTASGGDGLITVRTQNGCRATFANGNDWIQFNSLENNSETFVQNYSVAPNYGSQPRTGTFNVAGQVFTVRQASGPPSCVNTPRGLISWWRAENNAADSAGENNGTLINNPSFAAARVGNGFLFDGVTDRKILVPDSDSLALSGSMTIEGWIKLNSITAVGGKNVIIRKDDATVNYTIYITQTGKLWFAFSNISGSGAGHGVESPQPLAAGELYHVAATLDGATGQLKLFLNGTAVNTITTSARPFANLDPNRNPRVEIGSSFFNGVIDELSVYNRALSTVEVQAIYNAGTAPTGAIGKCRLAAPRTQFDFDGDGKADVSVFRPSNAAWYLLQSQNGFAGSQFGISTDKIAPGDFDGDGKTDVSVFRDGFWYRLNSSDNQFVAVQWGQAGDIPLPADFDGDSKADVSVFRPSNGTWYRLNSSDNQFVAAQFGANGDIPINGDFDGDGKSDYTVFRPSGGAWYFLKSADNSFSGINWGVSEDIPTAADYDGDGKTDVSVFRPSVGSWYRLNSSNNQFFGQQFGVLEDKPAAADYDGDGRADIAVFRPSLGTWYLQQSTSGFTGVQFGVGTDKPIPSAFAP